MRRLAAIALLALAGCCSPRTAAPEAPEVAPPFLTKPPYPPIYMGAPFRGVGSDGYPIYRACGVGRCG